MPKIIFNKESCAWHDRGLKMREYAIKNFDTHNYGFLDAFYHQSQIDDNITYRFKPLAKSLFNDLPEVITYKSSDKQNTENFYSFYIGLMGEPILTGDGQAAFDYIKRNESTLSINAIEKICGTKGSLKKALDRKQKQFGGSHKLIDWYLSLE